MPKTIGDIIPPSRRRVMDQSNNTDSDSSIPSNTTPLPPMKITPPSRVQISTGSSFPYGTALIVLVILAVCAGIFYAFSGAEVKITPMSQTSTINTTLAATSDVSGALPYVLVTTTKNASIVVPAESTQSVNDSAQGNITISNAQPKSQTLIVNTRFATPSGLIFKIHAPVTIPAASATGPGTITVPVFAEKPGDTYNVPATSFTVPGLKGSASYTLVTAVSTGQMTGGFSGIRPAVGQATDTANQQKLQATLSKTLQADISSKIPAGYTVIPGSSNVTYQTMSDTASSTSVAITEQGTMTEVAFLADALAKNIAQQVAGSYQGEPVMLASTTSLTLTPATATSSAASSTYPFSLSGTATIIWKVDPVRIAGAVAGKTRSSAQSILAGFPEIAHATLTLRPFWSDTFPQDPTQIHVLISSPAAGK